MNLIDKYNSDTDFVEVCEITSIDKIKKSSKFFQDVMRRKSL